MEKIHPIPPSFDRPQASSSPTYVPLSHVTPPPFVGLVVAVGGFLHETFWEDVTECRGTFLGWKDF